MYYLFRGKWVYRALTLSVRATHSFSSFTAKFCIKDNKVMKNYYGTNLFLKRIFQLDVQLIVASYYLKHTHYFPHYGVNLTYSCEEIIIEETELNIIMRVRLIFFNCAPPNLEQVSRIFLVKMTQCHVFLCVKISRHL